MEEKYKERREMNINNHILKNFCRVTFEQVFVFLLMIKTESSSAQVWRLELRFKDSIALPFKAGIVKIIQITVRTLVTFVLLSGLIMSSFQDFIFFVYDFVTIISSLRDL